MERKTLYYETSNSLSHHGIKGQKWGVRRFQNKDGTLTAKGKKRYADGPEDISKLSNEELQSRINRMRNEKRYYELTKKQSGFSKFTSGVNSGSEAGSKAIKTQKQIIKTRGGDPKKLNLAGDSFNAVSKSASAANKISNMVTDTSHARKTKDRVREMSDSDLNKIVARMDLEKQYSDISKETRNRGKVSAKQVLSVAGDVLAVTASVVTIGVGLKKLFDFGVKGDLLEDLKVPGM